MLPGRGTIKLSPDQRQALPRLADATSGGDESERRYRRANVLRPDLLTSKVSIMNRPTSATVFGILNILFSVLGFLGTAYSAFVYLAASDPINAAVNPFDALELSPLMATWLKAATILGFFANVVLLAAGVGLLMMRGWGRMLSLVYAVYAIVGTVIGMAMNWFFIVVPALNSMDDGRGPGPVLIGAAIGGVLGGCVSLIYPALLWYFMTRPRLVAAFAGQAPIEADNPWSAAGESIPAAPESNNPYASPLTPDAPAPASAADSIVQTFIPSRNGPALTSYYLGIFSLLPCLGLPMGVAAVYFGLQGLTRERQNPEVRGGAHAWVGLICGALFGLFNLLLVVGVIVGLLFGSRR